MIGITFPGSDQDIEILRAVRSGRPLHEIAQEYELDEEFVVALYEEYLDHRESTLKSKSASRIRQGYLDQVDALMERYAQAAFAGDLQAAKFVVAAIATLARLYEQFARMDAQGQVAVQTTSDARKEAETDYERRARGYHDLVAACEKLGIPTPEEGTRAYRALLSEEEVG